jgi:hypothetical protein
MATIELRNLTGHPLQRITMYGAGYLLQPPPTIAVDDTVQWEVTGSGYVSYGTLSTDPAHSDIFATLTWDASTPGMMRYGSEDVKAEYALDQDDTVQGCTFTLRNREHTHPHLPGADTPPTYARRVAAGLIVGIAGLVAVLVLGGIALAARVTGGPHIAHTTSVAGRGPATATPAPAPTFTPAPAATFTPAPAPTHTPAPVPTHTPVPPPVVTATYVHLTASATNVTNGTNVTLTATTDHPAHIQIYDQSHLSAPLQDCPGQTSCTKTDVANSNTTVSYIAIVEHRERDMESDVANVCYAERQCSKCAKWSDRGSQSDH